MSEYQEIVRFEENGKKKRFLHQPGSPYIFDDTDGNIRPRWLIEFTVPPFVPTPDKMKTEPARILTQWCSDYLHRLAVEAENVQCQ